MSCANENCREDPMNKQSAICVTCDGDFVCNEYCKAEWEKQRDSFFANIGNDAWYKNWMNNDSSNM